MFLRSTRLGISFKAAFGQPFPTSILISHTSANMGFMIKNPERDSGKAWPAIMIGLFVAFGGVLFGYVTIRDFKFEPRRQANIPKTQI